MDIVDILLEENLKKAFNNFGIEMTLQKIDQLYKNHPEIKRRFMVIYERIINQ